jgi:Meiotically up-regulated gene 113
MLMNREEIISAIQSYAKKNNGDPPGLERFSKLTGVTPSSWRGRIWLRWSDALIEAGFQPNQMIQALDAELLLSRLALLTRKYGRLPTDPELKMERVADVTFPSSAVFNRFGNKATRTEVLRDFAERTHEFKDIIPLLPKVTDNASDTSFSVEHVFTDGFVYMLKLGKHYKIGKTSSVPRRHREISLELPNKPDVVHTIRTDDPDGIEKYWHGRFAKKRTNGEWFALDNLDIRVFKKRKFM